MATLRAVLVLCCVCLTAAQIPSLGGCPEYAPMADFDMARYLGVWYEAERYFTMLEVASRCVYTNYTQGLDGKFHVSNQITNRLTGVKRVVDGELRSVGKAGEGKLTVKYSTLPVSFDTTFNVLETDYDTFSVMWSCSNLGVVNTQNAWVMTRDRLATGAVLQRAYGVLDKYKISRTFFMKTDQQDCAILEATPAPPAGDEVVAHDAVSADSAARVPATVGEKHSLKSAVEESAAPSEAMMPPAPIAAPEMPVAEAPKAEAPVEAPAPVVEAMPMEVEAPAAPAAPAAAAAADPAPAPAPTPVADEAVKAPIEPAKAPFETLVPQIPNKVQAAKSQIRKKVQV